MDVLAVLKLKRTGFEVGYCLISETVTEKLKPTSCGSKGRHLQVRKIRAESYATDYIEYSIIIRHKMLLQVSKE